MKRITWVILFLALIAGGLTFTKIKGISSHSSPILGSTSEKKEETAILFYGNACPHCQKVDDWLKKNPQIQEKSGLVSKEVYENKGNYQEMVQKAKECRLDTSQGLGVPFLFANGQCVVGDQPIIDYLTKTY